MKKPSGSVLRITPRPKKLPTTVPGKKPPMAESKGVKENGPPFRQNRNKGPMI